MATNAERKGTKGAITTSIPRTASADISTRRDVAPIRGRIDQDVAWLLPLRTDPPRHEPIFLAGHRQRPNRKELRTIADSQHEQRAPRGWPIVAQPSAHHRCRNA